MSRKPLQTRGLRLEPPVGLEPTTCGLQTVRHLRPTAFQASKTRFTSPTLPTSPGQFKALRGTFRATSPRLLSFVEPSSVRRRSLAAPSRLLWTRTGRNNVPWNSIQMVITVTIAAPGSYGPDGIIRPASIGIPRDICPTMRHLRNNLIGGTVLMLAFWIIYGLLQLIGCPAQKAAPGGRGDLAHTPGAVGIKSGIKCTGFFHFKAGFVPAAVLTYRHCRSSAVATAPCVRRPRSRSPGSPRRPRRGSSR